MAECIDAETRHALYLIGKIDTMIALERAFCHGGHNFMEQILSFFGREGSILDGDYFSKETDARRVTRYEMQVRAALFHNQFQKRIYAMLHRCAGSGRTARRR